MQCVITNTELSSREETRHQFNGGKADIKSAEGRIRPVCGLGIDVHQDFYVVVMQTEGTIPSQPSASKSKRSCTGRPGSGARKGGARRL